MQKGENLRRIKKTCRRCDTSFLFSHSLFYSGGNIGYKMQFLHCATVQTCLLYTSMVVLNGDILPDGSTVVPMETLEQCISKKSLLYDKHGEEHYNLISALHKSMRNSDPDAAVYWLARMLEAGEDPLYVARRLVRFASEDVGLADSRALEICVAAYQACHFLGMPECTVHLTLSLIHI